MFQPLIAILVSLSLVLGGTGVVTVAAQNSMPDEILYPVKTFSEDVRLALTTRPQTRLSLEQSFANRRVNEITTLAARGDEVPGKVANRLQAEMDESLRLAAGMDEPAMQQALVRMQTNTQMQLQTMAQVGQSTDPAVVQARIRLQEQLRLAELGLADPQGYQEQVRQRTRIRENQPAATLVPTQPEPQDTPTSEGGYGPGPQAGTQTGTPVQDGTGPGPGPGPMNGTLAPDAGNGNGQGGMQNTNTPGQGDGNGPGPQATATPNAQQGPGDGSGSQATPKASSTCTPVQDGTGPGPGPQSTPKPSCTCTPVQDGTGPGTGPGPMDPTRTPGSGGDGGTGGSGNGSKP